MLAETIQARVLWQLCPQPEVLALENKVGCRCIEDRLVVAATSDREAEWVRNVVELELGSDRVVLTRARQHRLGNLVDLVCCILDFDVETLICRWFVLGLVRSSHSY